MPVYLVKSPSGERVVKASAKSVAINHVIDDTITAEPLTTEELLAKIASGSKVEDAYRAKPIKEPETATDTKA